MVLPGFFRFGPNRVVAPDNNTCCRPSDPSVDRLVPSVRKIFRPKNLPGVCCSRNPQCVSPESPDFRLGPSACLGPPGREEGYHQLLSKPPPLGAKNPGFGGRKVRGGVLLHFSEIFGVAILAPQGGPYPQKKSAFLESFDSELAIPLSRKVFPAVLR